MDSNSPLQLFLAWVALGFLLFFDEYNIFVTLFFVINGLIVARLMLIILGLIKGPVLQTFEKYGDEENRFFMMPRFLFWTGLLVILASFWFSSVIGVLFPAQFLGILLIIGGVLARRMAHYAVTHPSPYWIYPHWLNNLLDRTSRLERRRIAYMWLRLPWKTRLLYNSNDRAFLEWADFIILSTLR